MGYPKINIETDVKTNTMVSVNGHTIYEVLNLATEMAHTFLEGASQLRADGKLDEYRDVLGEGLACRFLDMVGD
jgi:hypothetical protein